jgi:hypothetical protein
MRMRPQGARWQRESQGAGALSTGNPLLEAALQYAARSWKIFPLVPRTKRPAIKGWRQAATSDSNQIEEWWRARPDYNVGLACGESGLVVLDPDGPDGMAKLQRLVSENGVLPPTLVSQTANGFHLIFRGSGVRSTARGKLHVRGEGGLIALPPSVHPGGWVYCFRDAGKPIPELPEWVGKWRAGLGGRGAESGPDLGALPAHLAGIERRTAAPRGETWSSHEEARIRSALARVPADNYEVWTSIGMALCSLGWDRSDGTSIGFDIWDAWSQGCAEKYALSALESHWASFNRSGIGIGTLFHLAGEHGWKGEVEVEPFRAKSVAQQQESEVMQHNSSLEPPNKNQPRGPGEAVGLFVLPGDINGVPALPAALVAPPAHAGGIVFPDTNDRGRPRATLQNALLAIQGLGVECAFDVFHARKIVGGRTLQAHVGEVSDDAVHVMRRTALRVYGIDLTAQHVRDATEQLCIEHRFDPVVDYLDALEWDGVGRLAGWLGNYMGGGRDILTQEIGKLFLMAAVRRARAPGCVWDHIVVMEGPEGVGKSSALRILAGEGNFSDMSILAHSDREQQELIQGIWIYEIAELAGMRRADTERVKAFASRTHDRTRPAYGRFRVDTARRCVFAATTNEETYLKSETGNRRFWPVRTGRIELDALRRDRDQLWAEAVVAERAAGPWLELSREGLARSREEQDARLAVDIWQSAIAAWMQTRSDVSLAEVASGALHMQTREMDQTSDNRIARVLKRLGWERFQRRVGAQREWRYRRVTGI